MCHNQGSCLVAPMVGVSGRTTKEVITGHDWERPSGSLHHVPWPQDIHSRPWRTWAIVLWFWAVTADEHAGCVGIWAQGRRRLSPSLYRCCSVARFPWQLVVIIGCIRLHSLHTCGMLSTNSLFVYMCVYIYLYLYLFIFIIHCLLFFFSFLAARLPSILASFLCHMTWHYTNENLTN